MEDDVEPSAQNCPTDDAITPWYKKPEYRRYWRHYLKAQEWCNVHYKTQVEKRVSATQQAQAYGHVCNQYMQYYMWWLSCYQHGQWSVAQSNMGQPSGMAEHFMSYNPAGRGHPERKTSLGTTELQMSALSHKDTWTIPGQSFPDSDAMDSESEYEMEITEDMLEFLAQSARHKEERAAKKKEEKVQPEEVYVDLEDVGLLKGRASCQPPTERPGQRRTAEMKWLYGQGAAMIHGMETALQLNFDRNRDLKDPKLWPQLPINIQF